jgi:hypothetical protein
MTGLNSEWNNSGNYRPTCIAQCDEAPSISAAQLDDEACRETCPLVVANNGSIFHSGDSNVSGLGIRVLETPNKPTYETKMTTKYLKMSVTGTIGAAAIAIASAGVANAAPQDFNLVNDTGYPIEQVFVSPSDSGNWGHDILGNYVLPSGYYRQVTFPAYNTWCTYDVRVVFPDGSSLTDWNVDLCNTTRLVVS